MTPSDETFLQLAAQLAAGDEQFYISMQRRGVKRPDADEIALPVKLLLEYYRVVREAAAAIDTGIAPRVAFDPVTSKELDWTPG